MPYKNLELKRAYEKRKRAKHKERINASARKRRGENLDHVRSIKRAWYHRHADEVRERVQRYHIANRDKAKDRYTRRKFDISLEDYRNRIKSQNNRCAICGEEMRRPHLDHDHETSKIREFLCNYCNTAIGAAKENLSVLARMIEYLKKHKQENVNVPQCEPQLDGKL